MLMYLYGKFKTYRENKFQNENYKFRIGKKSTRLVNAAAVKLSEELLNMIERPDYARLTRVREETESQVCIIQTIL